MTERRRRERPTRRRPRRSVDMVKDIEESIKSPTKHAISTDVLIPSGSTMLNLACSDNPNAAYGIGKIVTMPGSSSSGKTILMLTSMAEMVNNSRFDDYSFYYDDGEEALAFDMEYLFGEKLPQRLKPPGGYDDDNRPVYSNTIQEFKANILTRCKNEEKFIYTLDSLDALTTDEELEKEYKKALLLAKGDKKAIEALTGSFKTEKAKITGEALRMINGALKKTDSALFIIQQIRQKIGVVGFGKKTTTSGGNAPFFYSTHQVWLNKTKTLKNDKFKLKIGNCVNAEITKNKLTGKLRDIDFDVFYDYGIDDISSMVDYLTKTKIWKKSGGYIYPSQFLGSAPPKKFYKKDLVKLIEQEGAEKEVKDLCGEIWNSIEDAVKLSDRKRKY